MENEEFRRQGYKLIDWIADYYQNIESLPVKSQVASREIYSALPDSAPESAGDPKSTDPDGLIEQFYIQRKPEEASDGFLMIRNIPSSIPELHFEFYNGLGELKYKAIKSAEL